MIATAMRTAGASFAAQMQVSAQYRASIFMWTFTGTLQVVVYLSVWNSVARASGGSVAGYDGGAFAAYFTILLLVRELTFTPLRWRLPQLIRTGRLSPLLLRPVSPLVSIWGGLFGSQLQSVVLLLPVVACVAIAFHAHADPSVAQLAGGLVLLPMAMLTRFLIDWTLANLAFWLTRIDGLNAVIWGGVLLLGGQFAPIQTLPGWLADVARWSPFYYALGYPVGLLVGRQSMASFPHALLVIAIWGVGLALVARASWRAGLRHYTAVGA